MIENGSVATDVVKVFRDTAGGDDQVDFNELMKLLRELGLRISVPSGRRLFRLFDEDRSGSVSINEFTQLIFPEMDIENLSAQELNKLQKRKELEVRRGTLKGVPAGIGESKASKHSKSQSSMVSSASSSDSQSGKDRIPDAASCITHSLHPPRRPPLPVLCVYLMSCCDC